MEAALDAAMVALRASRREVVAEQRRVEESWAARVETERMGREEAEQRAVLRAAADAKTIDRLSRRCADLRAGLRDYEAFEKLVRAELERLQEALRHPDLDATRRGAIRHTVDRLEAEWHQRDGGTAAQGTKPLGAATNPAVAQRASTAKAPAVAPSVVAAAAGKENNRPPGVPGPGAPVKDRPSDPPLDRKRRRIPDGGPRPADASRERLRRRESEPARAGHGSSTKRSKERSEARQTQRTSALASSGSASISRRDSRSDPSRSASKQRESHRSRSRDHQRGNGSRQSHSPNEHQEGPGRRGRSPSRHRDLRDDTKQRSRSTGHHRDQEAHRSRSPRRQHRGQREEVDDAKRPSDPERGKQAEGSRRDPAVAKGSSDKSRGGVSKTEERSNWCKRTSIERMDPAPKRRNTLGGEAPYRFHEVVRKKEERRCMNGCTCEQCARFIDALYDQGAIDSRSQFMQDTSRHRHLHTPPPNTPEGFWDLTI